MISSTVKWFVGAGLMGARARLTGKCVGSAVRTDGLILPPWNGPNSGPCLP